MNFWFVAWLRLTEVKKEGGPDRVYGMELYTLDLLLRRLGDAETEHFYAFQVELQVHY